ncbi:MAG: TIGR03545 family protein [Treponema sp.]|nr:TIGR03545 family protein [Treponema sp.]
MKKDDTTKTMAPEKQSKVPAKKQSKLAKAKVPSIFKKKYTKKALEKRVYKRIYVPADKTFIQSLFKETGKNKKGVALYSIPQETLLEKKDQTKLKTIAKEIRSQKGRIRWVPLIAAVSTIAIIAILFTTFKNRIIKRAIQNTCESIFEAKCDIDRVDFRLFAASFRLDGLQIANKDEPMKNLFSLDTIILDFDLTQALRGRFITDEVRVSGMATNTDRTYSGDISAKLAAKKAKKQDSAFVKEIKARSNAALDSMKGSVQGLFDEYNPETIIKNCYANMESPELAKKTEAQVKELSAKYMAKKDELATEIQDVQKLVEDCQKIDMEAIKTNPVKLKEAISTIDSAYKKVESLKTKTTTEVNAIKKDAATVKTLSNDIQKAIKHDSALISKEINKITSININDGKKFISGTLDGAAYQLLGKYYPYAMKLVDYLMEMKNSPKEENEPTEKEKLNALLKPRAKGKNIWYRGNPPKFWIKKLLVSGFNFSLNMTDIASDMDAVGRPAIGEFKIAIKDIDHTGTVTVDTRTNTKEPIVDVRYVCDKFPLALPTSFFGAEGVPGVPSLTQSKSTLDFDLAIWDADGFNITGTGKFTDMILTAAPFTPEFISNIYINTLAKMKAMMLSVQIGYRSSSGLNLGLDTDIDKQFIAALKEELKNQLGVLKKSVEEEMNKKINELTGGAVTEIGSFDDIYATITDYSNTSNKFKDQLEAKKKQANDYINGKTNEAIESAKSKSKDYLKGMLKQ